MKAISIDSQDTEAEYLSPRELLCLDSTQSRIINSALVGPRLSSVALFEEVIMTEKELNQLVSKEIISRR